MCLQYHHPIPGIPCANNLTKLKNSTGWSVLQAAPVIIPPSIKIIVSLSLNTELRSSRVRSRSTVTQSGTGKTTMALDQAGNIYRRLARKIAEHTQSRFPVRSVQKSYVPGQHHGQIS